MGDQPPDPLASVEACRSRMSSSPVYKFFFSNIKIVSASVGTVIARLTVESNHINSKDTLHGSVSATIVDWAGGLAIATHGIEKTGVSTDIHVTYVSGAKLGDILTIEGKTTKVGKNMGFTTVTIYKANGDDAMGTVVAHGTHSKYIMRDAQGSK